LQELYFVIQHLGCNQNDLTVEEPITWEKSPFMRTKKSNQSISKLLKTMQILRSDNGCPWDMEQTPESLTPYILEEASELVDAIESGDANLIMDELGDLLLQVVFQAQIFSEQGLFDFNDIAESINKKLVRRHPHVFEPDGIERNQNELDLQWETIKRRETLSQKVHKNQIGHIPSRLPSLQLAQKLISRLIRSKHEGLLPNEINLEAIMTSQTNSGETFGQLFLQLIIAAEKAGLDAEQSLRIATRDLLARCEDFHGQNDVQN
jgi:MazG family protein